MQPIHCELRKTFQWYDRWHSHPRHQHAHWLIFVSLGLLITSFLSGQILNLYYEEGGTAQAQTTLPAPNHPMMFGYIYAVGQYGNFISEVASFTNTQVILQGSYFRRPAEGDPNDVAGFRDAFNSTISRGHRIIFSPCCLDPNTELWDLTQLDRGLDFLQQNNFWNPINVIYLFDEPTWDRPTTESKIQAFRDRVASRGLSLAGKKILINYTPAGIMQTDGWQASNLDIVSFEAYLDCSAVDCSIQNNPNVVNILNTRIDQAKARIGNREMFIVVQAYNRNGLWTNMTSLRDVQIPAYLKAYNDPNVTGIWMFSWARQGGTRDLDNCIRTEHQRMWGAINGSAQPATIPCGGPPSPTPTPSSAPLPVDATPGWQGSLAYNSNNNTWLIVSNGVTGGIYGRIMDNNANPITATFNISEGLTGSLAPKVAFAKDANKYLVVWVDAPTIPGTLYSRFINPNGSFAGNMFVINRDFPGSVFLHPNGLLRYDETNRKFVLVWQTRSPDTAIYLKTIDVNGQPGPAVTVSGASATFKDMPALAINERNNEYCVAYKYDNPVGSVAVRRVNASSGAVGAQSLVTTNAFGEAGIAYNSTDNQYLVTWLNLARTAVKGNILNSCDGLDSLTGEINILTGAGTATVDYNLSSNTYAVVAQNMSSIANRFAEFDATGRLISEILIFTNGINGNFSPVVKANITRGTYGATSSRDHAVTRFISPLGSGPRPTEEPPAGPIPCTPGIVGQGVPIVCDFAPSIVRPGGTVQVSGVNLSGSVQLHSTSGPIINVAGTASGDGSAVSFNVPSSAPEGTYTLAIVSSDGRTLATSNKILTVTLNIPSDTDPTGEDTPFNPAGGIVIPASTTTFQQLIRNLFGYALIFVGIAVFVMIVWAGLLWMTSAANPGNIALAKHKIFNAIIGAILLLSSYVILYTINPDLVRGKFELPRIPGSGSAQSVRYLVDTESQAATAFTAGCARVRETGFQDFGAVECPGYMPLVLDPLLQLQDSQANQQVGATLIHAGGNEGQGRRIVILDTGYNHRHRELQSSYRGGRDFINGDNDPMDDQETGVGSPGHGSHVAGIITADGLDSRAKGVAPQTEIIAGKVLDSAGRGYLSIIKTAVYWAMNGPDGVYGTADDFRADVINLSVGGSAHASICDTADDASREFAEAIKYARDRGTLVVIAAGNNSSGVSMPGCIDRSFTVSAVDSSDDIAGFSGRGPAVDISAPGVNIYAPLLGATYGAKSGTSMATPIVSGIAALIKKVNPNYTVDELERALTSTARDLGQSGKDPLYGWGRVTAVAAGASGPPPPCTGACGSLIANPASCTKGLTPANPDCNITIQYTSSGVAPSSLVIRKDGVDWQGITNPSGSFVDNAPPAGIYIYTLADRTSGTIVASAVVYVYYQGILNASWLSCNKNIEPSNPNCDITLTYQRLTAPSAIFKNGVNWRAISPPSGTITDPNPAPGIHTYTIRDPSGETRVDRVVVTIQSGQRPRVITSLSATSGQAGAQITITGVNLGNELEVSRNYFTIQAHDSERVRWTVTGPLNPQNTQGTWTVPAMPPGNYTVRVGPTLADFSNEVPFIVRTPEPTPTPTPSPTPTPTPTPTPPPTPTPTPTPRCTCTDYTPGICGGICLFHQRELVPIQSSCTPVGCGITICETDLTCRAPEP